MFDPMMLLNSQFGGGLGSALGKGLQGAAPAGPSSADAAVYGSGLDASGWAVNFQGVQTASSSQDKGGGVPGVLGSSGVAGGVPHWAWLVIGAAVIWKLSRSKK